MKKYWDLFTDKFSQTPLHPQFIMLSLTGLAVKEAKKYAKNKNLVDIGCGRMPYRIILEPTTKKYIAVDHPQISKLYHSEIKPEILCDIAERIPLKNSSFDIALMFQVIEYLENPQKAFLEVKRILRPGGILIITTPFLYPLHDIPYDRSRFSETQIKSLLENLEFKIIKIKKQGNFIDFWFQSLNVYLLKRIMDILKSEKNTFSTFYLIFLVIITPPIILITNFLAIIVRKFKTKYPNYFPLNYLVVATKRLR